MKGSGLRTRWHSQVASDRRWQTVWALVVIVAVAAIVIGVVVGRATRQEPDAQYPDAVHSAAEAVTALMTFTPSDTPKDRAAVSAKLTGTIAADYASRGPDVVFPEATASQVSMKATVTGAAFHSEHASRVRVLVFVDQEIVLGQQRDNPTHTGVARWATVVESDGTWRLTRLEAVSPQ